MLWPISDVLALIFVLLQKDFNQEILNPKGLFLQYSLYPIMYKRNAVYKNCFALLGIRDFLYQRNLATGNSKTNLTNGLCREASRTYGERTCWHPLVKSFMGLINLSSTYFNQMFDMGNQIEFFSKVHIVFHKAIEFCKTLHLFKHKTEKSFRPIVAQKSLRYYKINPNRPPAMSTIAEYLLKPNYCC